MSNQNKPLPLSLFSFPPFKWWTGLSYPSIFYQFCKLVKLVFSQHIWNFENIYIFLFQKRKPYHCVLGKNLMKKNCITTFLCWNSLNFSECLSCFEERGDALLSLDNLVYYCWIQGKLLNLKKFSKNKKIFCYNLNLHILVN